MQQNEYARPRKRRRRIATPRDANAVEVLPEEVVSQLLNRSTAMVLQSVGFAGATAAVQESVHKLVDDCMPGCCCSCDRFRSCSLAYV